MAACAAWALNSASLAFSSACLVCSCVLICSNTCGTWHGEQQREGQRVRAQADGRGAGSQQQAAAAAVTRGAPSWQTASSEFRAGPWHHAPGPRDRSTCRRQRRGPRQSPSRRPQGPGRRPWPQQSVPSSWLQRGARRRLLSWRGCEKGRRCGLPWAIRRPDDKHEALCFGFGPRMTLPQVPARLLMQGASRGSNSAQLLRARGLQSVDGHGDVQRGQGDVQPVWPCAACPSCRRCRPADVPLAFRYRPPIHAACCLVTSSSLVSLPSYSQAGSGEGCVSFRAPRGLVWQEGLAGRPIQFGWGTGPGTSEPKKNRGSLQDGLAGDWGRRQHTPTAPQRRAAAALKHGVEVRLQPG